MTDARRTIVVIEARPRWEPELQRQFIDQPVRVRGCRSWSQVAAACVSDKTATYVRQPEVDLFVADLARQESSIWEWLREFASQPERPSTIAICSEQWSEAEWALRDAGIRDVLIGNCSGEQLAHCCRRMWSLS